MKAEFCDTVTENCIAPPGYRAGWIGGGVGDGDRMTRAECFRCGRPTCAACSARVAYRGKRRRLCRDCIEDERGRR